MDREIDPFRKFALLAKSLEDRGLRPVLVGGMALVLLGSQRITQGFDFVVSCRDLNPDVVKAIYAHGFEWISKLNPEGEVMRTIERPKAAAARLALDRPRSASFYDRKSELRIDLLLDFPLHAREIAERAATVGRKPDVLRVASPEDLLRLKEIAYADRKSAADAQNLEFLRRKLGRNP